MNAVLLFYIDFLNAGQKRAHAQACGSFQPLSQSLNRADICPQAAVSIQSTISAEAFVAST